VKAVLHYQEDPAALDKLAEILYRLLSEQVPAKAIAAGPSKTQPIDATCVFDAPEE
jgi:hypothetical protein